MLRRIFASNFRLFKRLELEFAKGIPTVLIGPNASGKSTVLEILNFGASLAWGQRLDQLFNVQRGGLDFVRRWAGTGPIDLSFDFETSAGELTYSVRFAGEPHSTPWIDSESIQADGSTVVRFNNRVVELFDESGKKKEGQNWGGAPGHSPCLSLNLFGNDYVQKYVNEARQKLAGICGYGPFLIQPPWIGPPIGPRDSAVVGPAQFLDRSGFNLVNVLFHRSQQLKKSWQTLLGELKGEFPFVEDLFFPPDASGGKIALGWHDSRKPGHDMFALQMSNGMVQFLCLLAALLVPPNSASALAFDEPDIHLHPSAIQRFISVANAVAAQTTVVIATHADSILDGLADVVESVRVCEGTSNGAQVGRLDKASLPSWLEKYRASELRRRGMIDPSNSAEHSTSKT